MVVAAPEVPAADSTGEWSHKKRRANPNRLTSLLSAVEGINSSIAARSARIDPAMDKTFDVDDDDDGSGCTQFEDMNDTTVSWVDSIEQV